MVLIVCLLVVLGVCVFHLSPPPFLVLFYALTLTVGKMAAFRGIVDRMQDDQVENQQIFTEASAEAATRRGGGRALAAAAAADERAAGGKRRRAAGRDDVDGEDGREQQHESEDRGVSSCWQQCIPEGDENVEMKDQSLGGAGARRLGGEVGKRTRGARDVSPGESRHESQGGVGRGGGSEQGLVLVDEDKVRNERSNSWSEKMAATVGQVAALAGLSVHLYIVCVCVYVCLSEGRQICVGECLRLFLGSVGSSWSIYIHSHSHAHAC